MPDNHHATLVVVRDKGVLIRGPSGAGKSSLAQALVEAGLLRGWFARLVADDQVMLESRHERLVGWVPQPLRGLVEIQPLGPVPTAFEARAQVDWVVDLVAAEHFGRMTRGETVQLAGVTLPMLKLPQGCTQQAVQPLLKIINEKFCLETWRN